MSTAEPQSAFKVKGQGTIYLVGLGHASTHWVHAMMIFLFPYIKQDFSLTYTEVGFLSMIMHISALACNVGSGPLVDMSGRRIIFLMLSLIGTGAALFLFGIAQSFLFICLLFYLIVCIKNPIDDQSDGENKLEFSMFKSAVYVLAGIFALSFGANFFVDGAIYLARFFGISEVVIGMSVVALGTSLPELATSAMAAFKKQS